MSVRRQLSSVALLAVFAAACATLLPPPREPIGADARRLLDLLSTRWQEFSDLRTIVDVAITRGGAHQSLTGVLLLKRPDSLRFEALSPFGQPFLFVTLHDGRLVGYDATANEAFTGPATAETTARLLGLPFDAVDLVSVLAGYATAPADLRAAEVLPPDERGPSLNLHGPVSRKRVWLDAESGIVRQQEIVGGRYEARVSYERDPSGHVTGLNLTAAQSQVTGSLRYREPVVDGGIAPERFVLTVPKGAKMQELR